MNRHAMTDSILQANPHPHTVNAPSFGGMGRFVVMGLVTFCAALALAAESITGQVDLSADADWRDRGVITVEQDAVLNLNGHTLTVGGLAGSGQIVSLASQAEGYKFYRFTIDANGGETQSVISEFVLRCGEENVTRPYKSIAYDSTTTAGGQTFGGSGAYNPTCAVDGDLGTKWSDWRAGAGNSAEVRKAAWFVLEYEEPIRITSYEWYNGHDTYPSYSGRTPTAWRLEGSNDGSFWQLLDQVSGYSAPQTNKAKAYFCDFEDDAGVAGNLRIDLGLANSSAAFDCDELTVGENVNVRLCESTLAADLDLCGLGTLIADGTVNLCGHVLTVSGLSGANRITDVIPCKYKYYRFAVDAIDVNADMGQMMLSEVVLYNGSADVTRQYSDIFYDSDTKTQSGQMFGGGGEFNPAKAVDGSYDTKWADFRAGLGNGDAVRSAVWLTLAYDEPMTVTGYAWYTAPDTSQAPSRSPRAWRLQGSNDNENWDDLDVVTEEDGFSAPAQNKALAYTGGVSVPRGEIVGKLRLAVPGGTTMDAGDELSNGVWFEKTGEGTFDASLVSSYAGDYSVLEGANVFAAGMTIEGRLVLGSAARIPVEVTGESEAVLITAKGGVDVQDADIAELFVMSDEDYTVELDETGTKVYVVEKGSSLSEVPVAAVWTGAGEPGKLDDPANWACYNANGELLPTTLPSPERTDVVITGKVSFDFPVGGIQSWKSLTVSNVVLASDCDWRGLGLVELSGTVDLDGHKLFLAGGSGIISDSGTTFLSTAGRAYRYYRFSIDAVGAGADQGCISELVLRGGVDVTRPFASIDYDRTTTSGGRTFGGGGAYNPEKAVDGDLKSTDSRWSDWRVVDASEDVRKAAWLVLEYADPILLTDYSWYSASDAAQYPLRMPTAWRLEGSNDRLTWIELDAVSGWSAPVAGSAEGCRRFLPLPDGIEAAFGELHIDIPEGESFRLEDLSLAGYLKLVKDGEGTLVLAKAGQGYLGGTVANDGTVRAELSGDKMPCGMPGGEIRVSANAVFDIGGKARFCDYLFMMDGGVLANRGVAQASTQMGIGSVTLLADSTFDFAKSTCLFSSKSDTVDLGGHALTILIGKDSHVWSGNGYAFTNGIVNIFSDGWFETLDEVDASTASFYVGCALNIDGDMVVKDYVVQYGGESNAGEHSLRVKGTFAPLTDRFYGCTLLNGSTLDLSSVEGEWHLSSAFKAGANTVAFADRAKIQIAIGDRKVKRGTRLVSWDAAPENLGGVRFSCDRSGMGIEARNDGLYLKSKGGLALIVY